MSVEHLEVLVEEPSMEAALRELLPGILGNVTFHIYVHQCKDDLLQKLPQRFAGYAAWLPQTWRILVLVDRDGDDCHQIKSRLEKMAREAKLVTKSLATDSHFQVANRLVIEELEAWYFGDWNAVVTAYPRVRPNVTSQAKYRHPDAISGGTWEAFERILQRAGYFETGLRKMEAARSISEHIVPERNSSPSFQVFFRLLKTM